jgi:hypothetical protein
MCNVSYEIDELKFNFLIPIINIPKYCTYCYERLLLLQLLIIKLINTIDYLSKFLWRTNLITAQESHNRNLEKTSKL